jgi:hypothetical protein
MDIVSPLTVGLKALMKDIIQSREITAGQLKVNKYNEYVL